MSDANAFDDESAERISRVVRYVEGTTGIGEPSNPRQFEEVVRALITGSTPDADGNYDAKWTVYFGGAWHDYTAVKVKPMNGEALTSGKRYAAKAVGFNGSGVVVLMVLGAAVDTTGGGGGGSLTVTGHAASPSYTGITDLRFETPTATNDGTASGSVSVTLTNPVAGRAAVTLGYDVSVVSAADNVRGVVNTIDQQILGRGGKIFFAGPSSYKRVDVIGDVSWSGFTTTMVPGTRVWIWSTATNAGSPAGVAGGERYASLCAEYNATSSGLLLKLDAFNQVAYFAGVDNAGAPNSYIATGTGAVLVSRCFGYLNSGTGLYDTGATGSLAGATVGGGIITALPSKPTVTGSRGGNAALASLLTALASLGIITNSTTP